MKKASVVIITKGNLVLAIDRSNSGQIGLPGGKAEIGEEPKLTAIRECYEETGLQILDCKEVFAAVVNGDVDYYTTAFLVKDYVGDLNSSNEGNIVWVTKEDLKNKDKSPFYDFNKQLFEII